MSVEVLEAYVAQRILKRLRGTTGVISRSESVDPSPLLAEVARIKESMVTLTIMCAEGRIAPEEYEVSHSRQRRKLEEAERRLARVSRAVEREMRSDALEAFLCDLGTLTPEEWTLVDREVQREIASLLGCQVTINPTGKAPRIRVDTAV